MRIDAHQHFWKYEPAEYAWISEEMSVLRRDFLPGDLQPLLEKNNMDGCILVQSEQTEAHTDYLLELAAQHDFIKGVSGWVDLRDGNIEAKLERWKTIGKLKGFRHILQGEPKNDMMVQPEFIRGIRAAGRKGYCYDILVYHQQLPYVIQMVRLCPGQKFVLDHLGKPDIRNRKIDSWKSDIQNLARFDNLYCKMSGLVTEAGPGSWKYSELLPYMDAVVESFGIDRIMFGSDWPVCLASGSYEKTLNIVETYFSGFSKDEKEKLFGLNAVNFYNIN